MKTYLKPVTESIDIQSVDHMMALAGSLEHGSHAPKKSEKELF